MDRPQVLKKFYQNCFNSIKDFSFLILLKSSIKFDNFNVEGTNLSIFERFFCPNLCYFLCLIMFKYLT